MKKVTIILTPLLRLRLNGDDLFRKSGAFQNARAMVDYAFDLVLFGSDACCRVQVAEIATGAQIVDSSIGLLFQEIRSKTHRVEATLESTGGTIIDANIRFYNNENGLLLVIDGTTDCEEMHLLKIAFTSEQLSSFRQAGNGGKGTSLLDTSF